MTPVKAYQYHAVGRGPVGLGGIAVIENGGRPVV
jgi:hypothetical protein